MGGDSSWQWAEGDEIAPGRTILEGLGGGSRYEVALVWDDERFALFVAKVLRPHVAGDEDARRDLALEAEALAALSHPVLLRGFDAVSTARCRTCSSSTSRARRCGGCSRPSRRSRSCSSSRWACTSRPGWRTWSAPAGCTSTSSPTT